MFVRGVAEISELFVAVKRIQQFLLSEEYQATTVNHLNGYNNQGLAGSNVAISMRDYTAKWNTASSDSTLININLSVPKGYLFGIIGPVGSGKSSLLQAVLSVFFLVTFNSFTNRKTYIF